MLQNELVIEAFAGSSVWIDLPISDVATIPTDMTATWQLLDRANTELAAGSVAKSADQTTFELRVPYTATTSLTKGTYYVKVYAQDTVTGYGSTILYLTIKLKV